MRRSPWLTLLAVVVALPGCGKDSSTNPVADFRILNCAKGNRYTIGQSVNGTLASTDCVDPGGSGRADYYQFTLASAGPVAITVASTSGTSPRIINAILTSAGATTHFRFTSLSGSTTVGGQLAAGTYVIVVAASVDNQTSSYTLTSSATAPAIFNCPTIAPIAFGQTVSGTFAANDCADPDGYAPADYYSFTLTANGPVTLRLTSTSGSAWLEVGDETDRIYGFDMADPSTPALLSGNLAAGKYIAIAAADDEAQTSGYTLQLTNVLTTASSPATVSRLEKESPWSVRRRSRW